MPGRSNPSAFGKGATQILNCVKLPKTRTLRALSFWSSLAFLFAKPVFAQTNDVLLERVVYLTPNLDSLTRTFRKQGIRISAAQFDPLGTERNSILLPSGQTIDLETTHSTDSDLWQNRALRAYGTHVSGITLTMNDVRPLTRRLDSIGIEHSPIIPTNGGESLRFAITGPQPLDIVFESPVRLPIPAKEDTGDVRQLRRISWLLFTTSPKEEEILRNLFAALGLTKKHEGCCDYWLIGPPENRIGVRFELPSTTFIGKGDWLSIEPGGVVLAY